VSANVVFELSEYKFAGIEFGAVGGQEEKTDARGSEEKVERLLYVVCEVNGCVVADEAVATDEVPVGDERRDELKEIECGVAFGARRRAHETAWVREGGENSDSVGCAVWCKAPGDAQSTAASAEPSQTSQLRSRGC